jgi:hypothetical protein|tara:strand:+ start:201 stop:374 length:174 start_codon:yes stop_codon:yes gene_type:complete
MKKIKVTPVNIRNGNKAPYYVISVNGTQERDMEKMAIEQAKSMSRLGTLDNWDFRTN